MQPNERRLIFTKLFYFAKRCNIKYKAFVYEKRKYSDTTISVKILSVEKINKKMRVIVSL